MKMIATDNETLCQPHMYTIYKGISLLIKEFNT